MTDFETTDNGKRLYARVNEILAKIESAKAENKADYKAKLAMIKEPSKHATEISAIVADRMNADKGIDIAFANELKIARENLVSAETDYNKELAENVAWKDLSVRKSTPFILNDFLKNGKRTEAELESDLHGIVSEKQGRFGFPLKFMEDLKWIDREGVAHGGDRLKWFLTDLGREQINFYNRNKRFIAPNLV